MAGAVDLSAVKARAEAAERRAAVGPGGAGPGADSTDRGAASGAVIDVTEATFQAVVERSLDVPVVLDLRADWAEPSASLSPILERLAAESGGAWVLGRVDVDASPRIAQALAVQSIPAVRAVYQGQLVAQFDGALPEPEVRRWIGALVDAIGGTPPAEAPDAEPEPDPALDAIEAAVASGQYADAQTQLEALLAADPAHPTAAALLGQVKLLARAQTTDPGVVAEADADPANAGLALAAADVQLATGDIGAALDRLLAVVRSTAGDDRELARGRLVELFSALGEDDPDVSRARRALSAALF